MPRNFYEGQQVRLEADFYSDGALADPTDIELIVWSQTESEFKLALSDVTKDGVGKYSHEFVPGSVGPYRYQWRGSGAVVVSGKGEFYVIGSDDE